MALRVAPDDQADGDLDRGRTAQHDCRFVVTPPTGTATGSTPIPRVTTGGPNLVKRTLDHSYVQRLIDEGQLTEAEATSHPSPTF